MSKEKSLINEVNSIAGNIFWRNSYLGVPDYIQSNLKHTYRPYQERAIENFMIFLNANNLPVELEFPEDFKDVNQLLFRMATGSGKTNIMAGAILALFREKNIQRFLFTTNLTSVIDKTKENLFEQDSNKYLFQPSINIDGETILIQPVYENQNFPNPEPNTIYIKVTSIQNLLNQLSPDYIKENKTTLDDLSSGPLSILVDEAHHFNKNATAATIMTQNETQKDLATFEDTIDRIRKAVSRKYPVYQLEFTATMPFGERGKLKQLSDKYIDKMIFDYNLEDFIENDGYGKNLLQIETTLSDKENMMIASLVSQYRKEYAIERGFIHFKPIILFKSSQIKISEKIEEDYKNYLTHLSTDEINKYLQKMENSDSELLNGAYEYYKELDSDEIILKLQEEFLGTSLNANNDNDPLLNFKLNSLEERNNPYRTVFAVERVSEGWDVLNLYDIVRIKEKTPKNPKTNAEAQLVGRGARYNPLIHRNGFEIKRQTFHPERKFYETDLAYGNSLTDAERRAHSLLLESLHYHTLKEPGYLKELSASYSLLNIPISSDSEIDTFTTELKENFKKSHFYKDGFFLENKTYKPKKEDFKTLDNYNVPTRFEVHVTNDIISENSVFVNIEDTEEYVTKPKEIDDSYIIEAMERLPFYRFNKMKKYMPTLFSKRAFIESEEWLGGKNKVIHFVHKRDEELTPQMLLYGTIDVMAKISQAITKNYMKDKGTRKFYPVPAKNYLPTSYIRNYKRRNDIRYRSVTTKWSPYSNMIINGLEEELVNFLENNVLNKIDEGKTKVYLLRNDEVKNGLKIFEFDSNRVFYPDFILYMQTDYPNHREMIQVYIEPKGEHLLTSDKWKEDLLLTLDEEAEIVIDDETKKFQLLGVKFYTENNIQEFSSDIKDKLNITTESEDDIEIDLFNN